LEFSIRSIRTFSTQNIICRPTGPLRQFIQVSAAFRIMRLADKFPWIAIHGFAVHTPRIRSHISGALAQPTPEIVKLWRVAQCDAC